MEEKPQTNRVICAATKCRKKLTGKQRRCCSNQCNKRTWAQTNTHNKVIDENPINKLRKLDEGELSAVRRGQYYDLFRDKYAEDLSAGTISV